MPLYKKKPFALVEKPEDLKPQELVFQIQLTKEIFRSYDEYLKRFNLYRKKVWTCKATGKTNLTYEEALVSERKASERIQNIPVEYVAAVLHEVQYSMLTLKDLVNSIAAKFQGPFSEGAEIYARKDAVLCQCKIVKVVKDSDKTQYEIAWHGSDKNLSGNTLVDDDDLTGENPPFSKRLLKSFIKDSTYRSLPWVLHDNLAKKHGISSAPPEELKSKISFQNGLVICNRKRKKIEDAKPVEEPQENEIKVYTRRNRQICHSSIDEKSTNIVAENNPEAQSIKYPIDDLLVQVTEEDRLLTERPTPCRDFHVPMECVGDLLMVWDFVSSFGKLLNLSPFSLEDFGNSVCYKDSTPMLIVESYSTILRMLVKESGKFSMAVLNKKRTPKITQITWHEYLCDFLETSAPELAVHISTIKRGHYSLLEVHVKLAIFRELIAQALETDAFREKLEEYIEERQALAAARRDEALHKGKKRREEKERKKLETDSKVTGRQDKSGESNGGMPNGSISRKNGKLDQSRQRKSSRVSEIEQVDRKSAKKQKTDTTSLEDVNNPSKRQIHKLMKNEIKEAIEMKSTEERIEFLEREISKRFIRTSPLGRDREYYRYWFFRRDGRIFVENSDSTQWGYYQTKEELDALIGSLNTKGVRERALKKQLEKFYSRICAELQKRSKEAVQRIEMEEALVRRSTRVRAPAGENPALAFLKYVNKWKEE